MTDHYFSSSPESSGVVKEIKVRLAGQDLTVSTAAGVFSPDHLDAGTETLLYFCPKPPKEGNFLDIGCGWGALALTLGLESPRSEIWAVDVNERALELTQQNSKRLNLSNIHACKPEEIDPDEQFDLIWSNPPIRVGKSELHSILEKWLPRLNSGGVAYLVAAKHLGADSLEKWLKTTFANTHNISRAGTRKGFRVMEVIKN